MKKTEEQKNNELFFQNKKYSLTSLNPQDHRSEPEQFEYNFLTAVHAGGRSKRGALFGTAMALLLQNKIKGKRILDYSCGRGDLSIYLA